ncbi:MAG: hypothetical protein ACP5M0_02440 [Desulfomonilaceae bacterium]
MNAQKKFKGLISSDWSECLSPNGPFDPLAFAFPDLQKDLERVFRTYTGNVITLQEAIRQIRDMLPSLPTREQMDAYLDASFSAYRGVPDFLQWCLDHDVLFMINTTSSQAYFQRAIRKGLIPAVPLIAANPLIQFPDPSDGDRYALEVLEIDDKAKNTAHVMKEWGIPAAQTIVIGDSGGDGPHFVWGSQQNAHLIASMAKPSLVNYCASHNATIHRFFGVVYKSGQSRDLQQELQYNFVDLAPIVSEILGLTK